MRVWCVSGCGDNFKMFTSWRYTARIGTSCHSIVAPRLLIVYELFTKWHETGTTISLWQVGTPWKKFEHFKILATTWHALFYLTRIPIGTTNCVPRRNRLSCQRQTWFKGRIASPWLCATGTTWHAISCGIARTKFVPLWNLFYCYTWCLLRVSRSAAGTSAIFYPSAPATGSVVDPSPLSNVIYYYDPVSGGVYSTLPALPGYDVTNSAYLYGDGSGVPLMTSAGYGVPGRAGSAAGHYLTALTTPQQPQYVQRLVWVTGTDTVYIVLLRSTTSSLPLHNIGELLNPL